MIIKGIHYYKDAFGVIHQATPEPFTYDKAYTDIYNTPEYEANSRLLMGMRLAFVQAVHPNVIGLQDIGCGAGQFVRFACEAGVNAFGYDVTGEKVPGVRIDTEYKPAHVYTLWDVFEHLPDLSVVGAFECDTIVMSMPYCHDLGPETAEWMETKYKHLKPNEHLHHFNPRSLQALMRHYGWNKVAEGNFEDVVRKSTHGLQNIFTMAFKRP